MATDGAVREQLRRYETVEWLYDGLGGKIIPWTKEHGGTSDDPACQAFVLHHDGKVRARAPDAAMHQAAAFARWLDDEADRYEKDHPPTRLPFARGDLERAEEEGAAPRCDAVEAARKDGRPALLYFGRDPVADPTREAKKEIRASQKFERRTLDSEKAADAAKRVEGLVLLRFDRGDPEAAAYARTFGVKRAPCLVLLAREGGEPKLLDAGTSGASLAYQLEKLE